MADRMSQLDEEYRDKIRDLTWQTIFEASLVTGPDGTKAAMIKSDEIIDAMLWIIAITTAPLAPTPDALRAHSSRAAKRMRALTRAMRRDATSLFEVRPAAPPH
jgi:hypothetical protein